MEILRSEPSDKIPEIQGLSNTLKMFKTTLEEFMTLASEKLGKEEEEYMLNEDKNLMNDASDSIEAKRPMDEEELPHARQDLEEEGNMIEVGWVNKQRDIAESRVLGIDFPAQFKTYIDEVLFKQLRNELYSKDNSMKINDALNFNVGSLLPGIQPQYPQRLQHDRRRRQHQVL